MKREPACDRFMRRVSVSESGCWEWTGHIGSDGYARFYQEDNKAGSTLAHRFSYEHYIGPIPAGLQIDHLCRNRRCVNPAHLEAVTAQENMRRSPIVGGSRVPEGAPDFRRGKRYAPKVGTPRETRSVQLSTTQIRYIERIVQRHHHSFSAVVSDLLDEAMGLRQPEEAAS